MAVVSIRRSRFGLETEAKICGTLSRALSRVAARVAARVVAFDAERILERLHFNMQIHVTTMNLNLEEENF